MTGKIMSQSEPVRTNERLEQLKFERRTHNVERKMKVIDDLFGRLEEKCDRRVLQSSYFLLLS